MFPQPQFRTKILRDFYPRAHEMRAKYDEFFNEPQLHDERHQVWDYWHVKNHYTYLRAQAARVIGQDLYNDFLAHLTRFAQHELKMTGSTGSFMSIYVNGCRQETHSDMMNGTYGWVFSLTNWTTRTFNGGETYVARENIFDKLEPREHRGGASYWEPVPAEFNQLTLFDDRVAHFVPVIQGQMDPLHARVVCHGHIY